MGQPGDGSPGYEPDWLWGDITYTDSWSFDLTEKVIFYTGDEEDKQTLRELYSFVIDKFVGEGLWHEKTPMTAITPACFSMEDDWIISEESMKFLKEGSVEQRTGTYTAFNAMGGVPAGVISKLYINGVASTTEIMDEDHYEEMLRMDMSKDMFITDKANLVQYHFKISNYSIGPLVIPNPLYQLSSMPKSVLEPHYDTELLGLPG